MNKQFPFVISAVCILLLALSSLKLHSAEVAAQAFSGEVLQVTGQRLQLKLIDNQVIWLTLAHEGFEIKTGSLIRGHFLPIGDAFVVTNAELEPAASNKGGSNE
ncbi:hypothetical protein [Alkalimonas mucilaginosa]|uniref:Uncharacterized protein n=1 Tax=Alkalimonas mucilaginosa TaxID=3057676 RepID=A0ABU7JEP1_9GAMM|nr:hypothetical protein [Alkalimonas sp. MEB004]MEE2023960.1 hypothetical protein [Alkalimonas sp. MEB004]